VARVLTGIVGNYAVQIIISNFLKRNFMRLNGTIIRLTAVMCFTTILIHGCTKEDSSEKKISDADGNIYTSVKIGNQVWMKENLKTTKYNDGTPIPLITDNTEWNDATTEAYCWYDNNIANKELYGGLYNWYSVSTGKLCPAGWHISTDADWNEITEFLGGETVAAGKMKTMGTIENGDGIWYEPNVDATNSSGFSAQPGGMRSATFTDFGYGGIWWTSSTNQSDIPIYYYINNYDGQMRYSVTSGRISGFSVRCVKD
jgi:uncharacterized protein (TIGR02145 family)